MPPRTKPAAAVEESSGPSSQDILSAHLKNHKDEGYDHIIPTNTIISTGSLILDSLVKVRSGGVVRLLGKGAELGKTSECFVLADNYMRTMPKAKTLYYKAEARLTPEIKARCGLKFVYTAEEWVTGTVYIRSGNVFEDMAELVESLLPIMHEAGEHLCLIVDSLDGLQLRNDREKAVWSKGESPKVAGVAGLTKLFFKRLGLPIVHYDVLTLATSQFTADVQLDPYAAKTVRQGEASGGNAIAHQADYVFQYMSRYQGDQILENPKEKPDYRTNRSIGVYATIEFKKSGTDVTGTKVRIPIKKGRVGSAIWVEREIVEMLISWELLAKKNDGSWLHFNPDLLAEIKTKTGHDLPEKVNGENNAFKLLEESPKEVVQFLFVKFSSLNNGEVAA